MNDCQSKNCQPTYWAAIIPEQQQQHQHNFGLRKTVGDSLVQAKNTPRLGLFDRMFRCCFYGRQQHAFRIFFLILVATYSSSLVNVPVVPAEDTTITTTSTTSTTVTKSQLQSQQHQQQQHPCFIVVVDAFASPSFYQHHGHHHHRTHNKNIDSSSSMIQTRNDKRIQYNDDNLHICFHPILSARTRTRRRMTKVEEVNNFYYPSLDATSKQDQQHKQKQTTRNVEPAATIMTVRTPQDRERDKSSPTPIMVEMTRSDFVKTSITSAVDAVTRLSFMAMVVFGAAGRTATAEEDSSAWPSSGSSSSSSSSSEWRRETISTPLSSSSTTLLLISSQSPSPSSSSSIQESSLSGIVAGASLAATKTLIKYPLDTATVRVQMPPSSTLAKNYSITRPFELFDGCWDGITFTLISNIPAGAVFFGVKDAVKTALVTAAASGTFVPVGLILPKWFTTTIAVAVAQIPYWIVRNPSEVIKVRQQTSQQQSLSSSSSSSSSTAVTAKTKKGRSAWNVIQEMMIPEQDQNLASTTTGIDDTNNALVGNTKFSLLLSQLYVGYWENVAYAFPADVLKFVIYESLKGYIASDATSSFSPSSFSPLEGAIIGATATALSQLLTTPLDVVRNRRMMKVKPSESRLNQSSSDDIRIPDNDPNYYQTIIQLGKEEGLEGLFAGAAPRVGKAILSGAIQFATYEETKTIMIQYFQNHVVK